MPLYMDIHVLEDGAAEFSIEGFAIAHEKDLAKQDKFGVIQHKYWVNEEAKTGFCLMEAPDKQACHDLHAEAHGHIAYNIIEILDIEFNLFMGAGIKDDRDLAHTLSGEIDMGHRTILMVGCFDLSGKYGHYINHILRLVAEYEGILVLLPNDEIMASFVYASYAMKCALSILKLLYPLSNSFEYSLSIVTGNPVDKEGHNLFEETKKKIQHLYEIGLNNRILIDSSTEKLIGKEHNFSNIANQKKIRVINEDDFLFLEKLLLVLNNKLHLSSFKSEDLTTSIGMSKAQIYRKVKSLTERSSNTLIRDLRLRRSLSALKKNNKTVAEIAYELGFNSPTYFTRVFRKRFGVLPTSFAKLTNAQSLAR